MAHSFKHPVTDSGPDESRQQRPIRSFVVRQGRLTKAQRRALEVLWPVYGLDGPAAGSGHIDMQTAFGRDAPLVLEIGFGNGDALAAMAAAEADCNFLGIEVYPPGVGAALQKIEQAGLGNVRIMSDDAVDVLQACVADASIDAVRLYFPDPWPKKRHHKRRLVQPEFADLVADKLKIGGLWHMATDWRPYAEHMLEVVTGCDRFTNESAGGDYVDRPSWRPETHFERRGRRLGHGVWDLLLRRY